MKLIFFIVALAIVYILTRSETFQEDGDFIEQKSQISPDQNQNMIMLTQKHIKDTMKVCSYCIETNKVQAFSRTNDSAVVKYKARYMFLVFSTYPYGIAVDVEILDGKITNFSTQPLDKGTSTTMIPYTDEIAHEFLSYDQMAQKPSPLQVTTDVTKK
jgi:hypothetical protein